MKVSRRSVFRIRRAFALLMTIVALAVVAALSVSIMKSISIQYQQLRSIAQRQQAYWLAQSGIERATVKLGADPDYRGETWEIPPAHLASRPATVQITVTPEENGNLRVRADATFPSNTSTPVRRSLEMSVTLD